MKTRIHIPRLENDQRTKEFANARVFAVNDTANANAIRIVRSTSQEVSAGFHKRIENGIFRKR